MGTVGMCIRIPGQRRLRERRRASFPFSAEAAPERARDPDTDIVNDIKVLTLIITSEANTCCLLKGKVKRLLAFTISDIPERRLP